MINLQPGDGDFMALARYIQHVSDVAKAPFNNIGYDLEQGLAALQSLILPDDEPDVLEEALSRFLIGLDAEALAKEQARVVRSHLDAAGYEIRRKDGA